MDSSSIQPASNPSNVSGYTFVDGDKVLDIHSSKIDIADRIDINPKDRKITETELIDYLKKQDILRDPQKCHVDEEKIIQEYKDYLQNKPLIQAKDYHTYDGMVQEMQELEKKRPDLCKMVSVGKSHEGRDIWALKISSGAQEDTSSKPGVVFTGLTHAREWISMEVPLFLANGLVNGYDTDPDIKSRLDNAEIWVLPMVNPDGYEYSRNEDSWWRKNRRPITDTGVPTNSEGNLCPTGGKQEVNIGVDLNRNFADGNPDHFQYWRPPGDEPGNYYDDKLGASDYPGDDTYRGPGPASESEVKAAVSLADFTKNIKGVIDFHSYGEDIMYPWGYTYDPTDNIETYKALGNKMNEAMGNSYNVMQSADLYPTSGSSEDVHHLNKRITFTIELARSFHPSGKDIEPTCKKLFPACNTFISWIIDNKDNIPWPDPQPPAPPQPPPPPSQPPSSEG